MSVEPFLYWLIAAAAAAVALAFALPRLFGRTNRMPGTGIALAIALPLLAFALARALSSSDLDADVPAPDAAGGNYRAQLVAHLSNMPRDARAWVALARLDMNEDRFADAAQHYAQAIDVSAKVARDPGVLCEYADALGMAQGGRLEGQPATTIERALVLDPAHSKALEMAGSVAYERGDYRTAARHWRTLLDQFPAGTPAHVELVAAIERAEKLAATTLPPASGSRGS
jgi:cytochrome c-type biogenesis protein CcmH